MKLSQLKGELLLCAVTWALAAEAKVLPRSHRRSDPSCQQLANKYLNLVAFPNSTIYNNERIEYWDKAAVLLPSCIFTPGTSEEVAGALKILADNQSPFAIRSGGHTPIPGASGIDNGVLIASDKLKNLTIGEAAGQQVVKVGSGNRWIEVYEWLAKQGLTCIGGRYATVGLGGLLLGGGISYYRSVSGWAADHIVNYELVTAQGNVLQVNRESNSDLFWALKGGSGNFGFVTSFDLQLFPLIDIYGGNILTDASGIDALIKASASYADPVHGGVTDPLSAVNPTVQFALDTRERSGFTNVFYNASIGLATSAVKDFTTVPSSIASTITGPRSFVGFMNETAAFPNDMRRLFRATSVKLSSQAVKIVQKVFDDESAKLRTVTNGSVTVTYQYLSQPFVNAAHAAGNAIDLLPENGPLIAILLAAAWISESDDDYLLNFAKSLVESIDSKSKAAGLYYPYIFFNDAGIGQSPFSLYGGGVSLSRMRKIAQKYDPHGVFQRMASGAFKL